jgi:hypothetical protein
MNAPWKLVTSVDQSIRDLDAEELTMDHRLLKILTPKTEGSEPVHAPEPRFGSFLAFDPSETEH